ncbi:uncharacterized protein J8A68_000682 [[Candida] subhashii]|uniref:Cell wall protein n=1 Tax=[Candida] subhashii TaxID=561895 RepID=A0A8J5QJG1_9ASCO|nr:uncharacterized protein J8A68_000682 [[Candida] subhashii]KAG7665856.1 hypothetical protein J8A68_000682 [[Candida] subhashii]
MQFSKVALLAVAAALINAEEVVEEVLHTEVVTITSCEPYATECPVAPEEPAPVAPEEPAPVAPEEPAPVAPEEPAPVAPEEPAPVAPEEPAPIAPEEPAPVPEEPPVTVLAPVFNETIYEGSANKFSAGAIALVAGALLAL